MIFIAIKTKDGEIKGKLSFYCKVLKVGRQAFYKYLLNKDRSWKYQALAETMKGIAAEDEYNDIYGCIRMYRASYIKKTGKR